MSVNAEGACQRLRQLFQRCDKDGDGVASLRELLLACRANPEFIQLYYAILPPGGAVDDRGMTFVELQALYMESVSAILAESEITSPATLGKSSMTLGQDLMGRPVSDWDEADVADWLSRVSNSTNGIDEVVRMHAISGPVLLSLTEQDLAGLRIESLQHQRLLLLAARELRAASEQCNEVSRAVIIAMRELQMAVQAHERMPDNLLFANRTNVTSTGTSVLGQEPVARQPGVPDVSENIPVFPPTRSKCNAATSAPTVSLCGHACKAVSHGQGSSATALRSATPVCAGKSSVRIGASLLPGAEPLHRLQLGGLSSFVAPTSARISIPARGPSSNIALVALAAFPTVSATGAIVAADAAHSLAVQSKSLAAPQSSSIVWTVAQQRPTPLRAAFVGGGHRGNGPILCLCRKCGHCGPSCLCIAV